MRTARVGETVVCVDNSLHPGQEPWRRKQLAKIRVGRKYVVSWVGKSLNGDTVYKLRGIRMPIFSLWTGYKSCRFEILPEKKDWVAEFKRRAESQTTEVPAGDLVSL